MFPMFEFLGVLVSSKITRGVKLVVGPSSRLRGGVKETSQELRMLSSVTINCQITKIVMNSGSQWSEL